MRRKTLKPVETHLSSVFLCHCASPGMQPGVAQWHKNLGMWELASLPCITQAVVMLTQAVLVLT